MWTYHTTNTTTISSVIEKHSTYTESPHPTIPSSPYPEQALETHEPSIFNQRLAQQNHHNQGFSITTSKISYSLIELQVLLSMPTCRCKSEAQVIYLHSTFIAPSQSEVYLGTPDLQHFPNKGIIQKPVKHLRLSFFAKTVNVLKPLIIFAKKLHRRCSTGFQMRLCPIICYSSQRV